MYNQNFQATINHPDDIYLINSFDDKENIRSYIDLTAHVFDTFRNNELLSPVKQESSILSSWLEPSFENQASFAKNIINTPSCFWVACASEQILSPISANPKKDKRLSTEIVKRYSLSANVQKIYFSQVSFYVDVDILLNTEAVSDEELDKFFGYEQELLDTFDIPMNFNYRPKNSFYAHSENNVLVFEQ